MKRLLFPLAAALALAGALHAHAFSYQGVLADEEGNALTGNKAIEFRLYINETGGTALWGRACNVLLDEHGMFNTEISDSSGSLLGDVSAAAPLDQVLAVNSTNQIYMGIYVKDSSGEIAPRLRLLPVPYAVFAQNVARASGNFDAIGKVSAAELAVSAKAEFSSATSIAGDASVEGNLTVSGTVSGYGSVPVGTIVLWSGSASDIPEGWSLCNGQTVGDLQTPDLRGRFVVGYDSGDGDYAVGSTGGEKTHTLTTDEMPSHNHSYSFKGADLAGSWKDNNYFYNQSEAYPGNNNTKYTDSTGGSAAHENRPPYYTLCYIMRTK